MKRLRQITSAASVAALGLAIYFTSGPSVAPAAASTTLPAFGHVVIVIGENTDYSTAYGGMSYLDSLANAHGLATNYYADTHPSIGNYFVLTAGQIFTNNDSDTPSSLGLSSSQDNIAHEVELAGKTWKDYVESTGGCGALNSGTYYVRHDPLRYYPNINTESANFVCMSQFATDVSAGTLPNLSWLVPNGCDDAHDCSIGTFDSFLNHYLTPLMASKYFQPGGDGLLIVTWDENSGSGSTTTTGTTDGGQVETVIVSPYGISSFQSSTRYYHENTLRTIAQGLGAGYSGLGAAATAAPMSDFFTATSTVSLSPSSLSFTELEGSTSTAQALTLTNGTSSSISISGVAITGTNASDFAQTHTCGTALGAGASCTIDVTFTAPTTAGTYTATLTVTDSGTGGSQSASLTGTATSSTSGPVVTLTPSSVTFPSQAVGTTSAVQYVTLANTGSATLTFSGSFTITGANAGDFAFAGLGTCGSSVAAGSSCTISLEFKPTATGTRTAQVNISDNAPGSPQTIPLTGTGGSGSGGGGGSTATLSPSSMTFGSTTVGSVSAYQTATLTNNSTTTALTVSSFAISPNFKFAGLGTCSSTLAAGASCTITVEFAPTTTGTLTGSVTVTDSASNSPQTISLSGTGTTKAHGKGHK